MRIGTLDRALVQRGLIPQDDLERLRAEAAAEERPLAEHLLETKSVGEPDLLRLLADLYGVEFREGIAEGDAVTETICRLPIHYLKKHRAVPLHASGTDGNGGIVVATSHPATIDRMDEFGFALGIPAPRAVLMPTGPVLDAVNQAFGSSQESSDVAEVLDDALDDRIGDLDDKIEDLLDDSSDAPFIRLVNMILAQAVRAGASDVHIEPYKDTLRVRFRLDGVLYDKHSIAKRYHAAIVSRIKIMAKLNIAEKRLPQDGRIALSLGGRQVDLRVSTLPTSFGERVVMRLLEKSSRVLSMSELGLMDDDLELMKKAATISHGIILVTGPTGSGKTTSLYAVLNHINSPDKNILTIEDPVEYQLDGVGQIQVNHKIGLTFAQGLRSIVRQDPDVILIGEIRDKETADIAIQSALTGHLVFSTLHTNDAPSAITRLIDMGVEPFLLSSVLRTVVAQRLVRTLCPECKTPFIPDDEALANCNGMSEIMHGRTLHRATGCPRCMNTGYKGRRAIYEIMQVTDAIKSQMLRSSDSNQLRVAAMESGMRTLKEDGCRKALLGITSLTEVTRVTNL